MSLTKRGWAIILSKSLKIENLVKGKGSLDALKQYLSSVRQKGESFLSPPQVQEAMGLSLTSESLALVQLQRGPKGIEVKEAQLHSVTSKEGGSLEELLQKAFEGRDKGRLVTSLPRHAITTRVVCLPSTNEKEIEEMVRLEADQYVPYSPEELVLDQFVLRTIENGYSEVMVIIAHKDVVHEHLSLFSRAGLEPEIVELSSLALFNAFINSLPPEALLERESRALLHVSQREVDLCIVHQGLPVFTRAVCFEKDGGKEEVLSFIENSLATYEREEGKETIEKIALSGSPDLIEALGPLLEREYPQRVQKTKPWANMMVPKDEMKTLEPSLAIATGLALRGCKETPFGVNLLPPSIVTKRKAMERKKAMAQTAILSAALIFLFFVLGLHKVHERKDYLDSLKAQGNKLKPEAETLKGKKKRVEIIENLLKEGDLCLDVFAEAHRVAPERIVLTDFSYKRNDGSMVIKGQARERVDVIAFSENLRKSPFFTSVVVGDTPKKQVLGEEVVAFEIGAITKKIEEVTPLHHFEFGLAYAKEGMGEKASQEFREALASGLEPLTQEKLQLEEGLKPWLEASFLDLLEIPQDSATYLKDFTLPQRLRLLKIAGVEVALDGQVGSTGVKAPLSILIQSHGNGRPGSAKVELDGELALVGKRGYNFVVIDPVSGKVEMLASFDTYASTEASDHMVQFIDSIPLGSIVAAFVWDEASTNLTDEASEKLKTLGAQRSIVGLHRSSHALLGVKGASPGQALEIGGEGNTHLVALLLIREKDSLKAQ